MIQLDLLYRTLELDISPKIAKYRYKAVSILYEFLASENSQETFFAIQAGAIPELVNILNCETEPTTKLTSVQALALLACESSKHVEMLISHRAVEGFICGLLSNQNNSIREQCVWALGNIAGNSSMSRDYILHANGLSVLLRSIDNEETKFKGTVVWAISNLCKGKPAPLLDLISPAVPILATLMNSPSSIGDDACIAISYLCDAGEEIIPETLKNGICKCVVNRLLTYRPYSKHIQMPALIIIGNLVTTHSQTDVVISCGALVALHFTLQNAPKALIQNEVCHIIAKIAAGTVSHIEAVFEAGLIDCIIPLLLQESIISVNATTVIKNVTLRGNASQIQRLVTKGCIPVLCDRLMEPNERIITLALEALEKILPIGDTLGGTNPNVMKFVENEGHTHLKWLIHHCHSVISQKAKDMLDEYFYDQ